MRIEIPMLPPASSSPNAREHWAGKYQDARVYHDAVFYQCVNARNLGYLEGMSFPFLKAKLKLTFVFKDHRRRDRDNLITRFKPGQDSIVDSGLILDDDADHLETGDIVILVDPEQAPLTIIELDEHKGKNETLQKM